MIFSLYTNSYLLHKQKRQDIDKTNDPYKALTKGFYRNKGRNNRGVITSRHKGGGHKRLYRKISFKRENLITSYHVIKVEYDPNRTANIALVTNKNLEKKYIIHPHFLNIGDIIQSGSSSPIKIGNSLPLYNIPIGMPIHNISLKLEQEGKLVRAAGTFAQIIAKQQKYIIIKLPSSEIKTIPSKCHATIGQIGNKNIKKFSKKKAGRNRWLGKRPHVRGVAMNPVDHPHGGGEGKSPIGRRAPSTYKGKKLFGVKTRKKNHYSNYSIIKSRSK
uniref:Large ribosomal subunit protein uL2m n=1 Tax=Pterocladiophila hemisphaerica TaxID=2712948 RepID=A0A6M3WWB4_9FLOR|nr:ribosomal protein L2 [Pterocladiophila hemisphaerica]